MQVLWLLLIHILGSKAVGDDEICLAAPCIKASSEILEFVDNTVDPCQDFYQFACGNFMKNAYKSRISEAAAIYQQMYRDNLFGFVSTPIAPTDSKTFVLQKLFYKACMNETSIDEDQDQTFLKLIEKIGGWPLLMKNEWNEGEFHWTKLMVDAKNLGLPYEWFVKMEIKPNTNESKISPPVVEIVESSREHAYVEYMIKIALHFNSSLTVDRKEFDDILRFQKELYNITNSARNEISFAPQSLKTITQANTKISWHWIVSNLSEVEITEDLAIVSYYLPKLMNFLEATSERTQVNYIVWNIVNYFTPFLSKHVREETLNFQRLSESCRVKSRFEQCVIQAGSRFKLFNVQSNEYLRSYIKNEQSQQFLNEISGFLKGELEHYVNKSEWMNDDLRNRTYRKFYSTENSKGDSFDTIQYELIPDPNIIKFITKLNKNFVHKPNGLNPPINSDTVSIGNNIDLPKFNLQEYLYDLNKPMYYNYGGVGSAIGLAMGKGLVDLYFESDWSWGNAEQKYLTCDGQSSIIPNEHAVGINMAYAAYQSWVNKHGKEAKLPALPFTPNQIFWIKSTTVNCYSIAISPYSKYTREVLEHFRNITHYAVKNAQHFGHDFGCAKDSPMNPSVKCALL